MVEAHTSGEPVTAPAPSDPEARLMVLDPALAAELARLERQQPRSHLLLGVAYSKAGLLEDAEREFRALEAANPGSPVAKQLLQRVHAMRKR
jgi:hypothetical protein